MLDQFTGEFHGYHQNRQGHPVEGDTRNLQRPVLDGQQAIELGLADQLGNLDFVAREVVKAEEMIDYTRRDNVAERLVKAFWRSDWRRRNQDAEDDSSDQSIKRLKCQNKA